MVEVESTSPIIRHSPIRKWPLHSRRNFSALLGIAPSPFGSEPNVTIYYTLEQKWFCNIKTKLN